MIVYQSQIKSSESYNGLILLKTHNTLNSVKVESSREGIELFLYPNMLKKNSKKIDFENYLFGYRLTNKDNFSTIWGRYKK